ncbi:MAG: hypothetical protein IKW00_06715 [Clostridia bacterium]|nr:hypothetical protein [Clostridia bacterium]
MKDYLLQTCVRLHFNYADLPFSAQRDESVARRATDRITAALERAGDTYAYYLPHALNAETRRRLTEKGLLHPDTFAAPYSVLYLRMDEALSVQTALGDHAVIAAYDESDIQAALERASAVRTGLSETGIPARDEEYGYLTAHPCHAGEGMTVQALLHLPMLRMTGQSDKANAALSQKNVILRPFGGVQAKIPGGMYILENRACMGKDAGEYINEVMQSAKILTAVEERFRTTAREKADESVYDAVWRALGVAKYARKITIPDARHLWSMLTLGAAIDAFEMDEEALSDLWELACGKAPCDQEENQLQNVDMLRAQRVRFLLNGGN